MNASSTSADSLAPAVSKTSSGPKEFSYEAIHKLPRAARYFNVSVLWIAYYAHLTRLFYALRIRHEIVTLMSIASGLSAAAILMSGTTTAALILCAVLVHLKDVFDACDGSLARLTGKGHRIGRFLDTIGDGVVFTALVASVAWYGIERGGLVAGTLIWAGMTWLSLFLQCSYFNYYHLRYTRQIGASSLSHLDEHSANDDDGAYGSRAARLLLAVLQQVYLWWFGWQDRLIQHLDRSFLRGVRRSEAAGERDPGRWYGARAFLVATSALCYGTHAFVLILCLLAGHPAWFFPAVVVGMNLYWVAILVSRWIVFRGAV